MIDPHLAYEATGTVTDDRMDTHGHPWDTMEAIARMWGAYLQTDIKPEEVAQMMILVKIARAHRNAYERDHYLDMIGYILIAESMAKPWSASK